MWNSGLHFHHWKGEKISNRSKLKCIHTMMVVHIWWWYIHDGGTHMMVVHTWWWYIPVVPEPGSWNQEEQEFKVIFSYIVRLRTAWVTETLYQSPQTNKQINKCLFFFLRLCSGQGIMANAFRRQGQIDLSELRPSYLYSDCSLARTALKKVFSNWEWWFITVITGDL